MISSVLYISENVIATVQFSQTLGSIMELQKTDFDGDYLENGKSCGQSTKLVWGDHRKHMHACLSGTLLGFDPE